MSKDDFTASLQEALDWRFQQPELLRQALTHSTYANEHPDAEGHNERLEFVGDAVLGLLTAELLYQRYPSSPEGELSQRRARVVRREGLEALARNLHLSRYLRVGAGAQKAGEHARSRVLADAYEAVVGAVFLDGGYDAVRRCFTDAVAGAIEAAGEPLDFKTQLQEACHRRGMPTPKYEVVSVEGPDHARQYHSRVWIGEHCCGEGRHTKKKSAEQECARQALARLKEA